MRQFTSYCVTTPTFTLSTAVNFVLVAPWCWTNVHLSLVWECDELQARNGHSASV